jgi:hypothetical protein
MITRSMGSLCTCADGACPRCSGAGRLLCTLDSGHWGEYCPFCGGTGERECEWCHGTGKHALCGGTGVIRRATRSGIAAWPTPATVVIANGDVGLNTELAI